jgi:hypothetical protein
MASAKPLPSSPRMWSFETRTSLNTNDAGPHSPIVSIGAEVHPRSRSTRKQVTPPSAPFCLSVTAKTMT